MPDGEHTRCSSSTSGLMSRSGSSSGVPTEILGIAAEAPDSPAVSGTGAVVSEAAGLFSTGPWTVEPTLVERLRAVDLLRAGATWIKKLPGFFSAAAAFAVAGSGAGSEGALAGGDPGGGLIFGGAGGGVTGVTGTIGGFFAAVALSIGVFPFDTPLDFEPASIAAACAFRKEGT